MRPKSLRGIAAIALISVGCALIPSLVAAAGNRSRDDARSSTSARDSDDPIAGVGLALKMTEDDEYPIVNELIAEGSAAEDGHIKAGDQVVGIEKEDGTISEFKGKPLMEIILEIRGPVDTKIKLVVRHKGEEGRKTYELKRKPLPTM